MFYLDTQRTVTRRDSSLVSSRKTSAVSVYDRDPYSPSPVFIPLPPEPEPLQQPRARGSVKEEITNLFFESMLKNIVNTWQVLEYKKKKTENNESSDRPERLPRVSTVRQARKSRIMSYIPSLIPTTLPIEMVWWSAPDQKAVIHFKNGSIYEGDISSKCMHGNGRYQWADGTVYIGEFRNNNITGRGTIEWKDHTWYSGDFVNNLRHGKGLFVDSRLQRCYTGSWHCGAKHGQGFISYSWNFENSYEGEWHENTMHGCGVRDYCSESAYFGKFQYSTREGRGEMILPCHDFYRGQWENGIMHGHGYYIWNAICNKSMSAPHMCSYFGSWYKRKRHGNGLLHFGPGLVSHYKGKFVKNKKHERGLLVTADGLIASDNKLFNDDRFYLLNKTYILDKLLMNKTLVNKITVLLDETRPFRSHIKNAIKNHKKHVHNNRVTLINKFIKNNEGSGSTVLLLPYDDEVNELKNEDLIDFEDRGLRLAAKFYESRLLEIYCTYAKICNHEPIHFPAILIRLYFWQLCYDCKFHDMGFSLTELDNLLFTNKDLLLNDPHDPFERIHQWQFLHILITIACQVYVRDTIPGPKPDTMVASAFSRLMETNVIPNVGQCKGKLLHHTFVPLPPLYNLYLSLEQPRTVRKFLCAARIAPNSNHPQPPLVDAKTESLPRGNNFFLFGDELVFVPERNTIVKEAVNDNKIPENLPLFNFGNLASLCIVKQFASMLPNLVKNDIIMNIEKEITFYEFFEAFICCTEESIRRNEEDLSWKVHQDSLHNSSASVHQAQI